MNTIFINDGVNNGIISYSNNLKNYNTYLSHYFEFKVIEFLAKIYGKTDIINPYIIKSELDFKKNLAKYGASMEDINILLNALNEYSNYLNGINTSTNTIMEDIFTILCKLVILKNKSVVINSEEMLFYENFLNVTDNKIRSEVIKLTGDINRITSIWPHMVKESQVEPKKVERLPKEEYQKQGLFLADINKLSDEELDRLNNEILRINVENTKEEEKSKLERLKRKQIILSSGNGFIDALVLLSIMCTEIMIGIVITIIIARLK